MLWTIEDSLLTLNRKAIFFPKIRTRDVYSRFWIQSPQHKTLSALLNRLESALAGLKSRPDSAEVLPPMIQSLRRIRTYIPVQEVCDAPYYEAVAHEQASGGQICCESFFR